MCERGGVDVAQVDSYGLFVPPYAQTTSKSVGWLPVSSTLAGLGLQSGVTSLSCPVSVLSSHFFFPFVQAELDFRQRVGRKRVVWTAALDRSSAVSWNDGVSLKRNLVEVGRDFGRRKMLGVMPPVVNHRVVILNKNELLVHYPLPETAEFVVSVQEGWKYSPDCTDDELLENIFFFVQTPSCEGEIWKKTATGFRRGWKKLWAVLQKETLAFYPDSANNTPVGGVHIRNLEFCYQSEAIDAQSKKLGNIFKLGTTGSEKVVYLGVSQKDQLQKWINCISEWIEFCEFFRPKAITERGFALSHILSGQIRPNPKTYPGGESSAVEHQQQQQHGLSLQGQQHAQQQHSQQQAANPTSRASAIDDTGMQTGALEVQPNREVSVVLRDGSLRDMVVDSRLDVYELAYMIAEEIRSENAFIISPDDFGPHRTQELLDHQSSLASQQIPLSAKFSIRKTGIVDDFVKECDIYDNHFLFVSLPHQDGQVLIKDEAGAWRHIHLQVFAGKLCCVSSEDHTTVLALVLMRNVLSIYHSSPENVDPQLSDFAFSVALSGDRELHFLASSPDACDEWCDLDGWCGFNCNNVLLDPTEGFSWKLYDFGSAVDNVAVWLGLPELPAQAPLSPRQEGVFQQLSQPPVHGLQLPLSGDPMLSPSSSLSPISSPRILSPRSPRDDEGEVVVIENDDDEDSAVDGSVEVVGLRESGSGKHAQSSAENDLGNSGSAIGATSGMSSPPSSTSPRMSPVADKSRIKRFDWRKGSNASSNAPAKRRSVEELFLEEAHDDDDGLDSESSIALRVPSDDDEFDVDVEVPNRPISPRATSKPKVVPPPVVAPLPAAAQVSQPSVKAVSAVVEKPPAAVTFVPASTAKAKTKPQLDVSRLIRRAYESVEPVKLKALPDNDPSLYCWKVLHSINLQKLGYATLRDTEVVFYDLRGHEVLRVAKSDLPGLVVPPGRQAKVDKTMKQMRKSSKLDVTKELLRVYDMEGSVCLRRARDAEFEFRVVLKEGGEQIGWASRSGLDTLFYDMNGMSLTAIASELLGGQNLLEPSGPSRLMPTDVRSLFKTQKDVTLVKCVEPGARHEFKVLLDDGTHVGWGEREAFDFAFADLTGRVLGRLPLVAMPQLIAAAAVGESGTAHKKRSSSGATKGSMLGRLKDAKKNTPATSPTTSSAPVQRSGSATSLLRSATSRSATVVDAPGSPSPDARRKEGRRLSEWQSKMRGSGPFKPSGVTSSSGDLAVPAMNLLPARKERSDSVDYTPDGLSPELQDSGYDAASSHRPMGLAGLLGEPTDE